MPFPFLWSSAFGLWPLGPRPQTLPRPREPPQRKVAFRRKRTMQIHFIFTLLSCSCLRLRRASARASMTSASRAPTRWYRSTRSSTLDTATCRLYTERKRCSHDSSLLLHDPVVVFVTLLGQLFACYSYSISIFFASLKWKVVCGILSFQVVCGILSFGLGVSGLVVVRGRAAL